VPAIVLAPDGHRIGYGAGFYDRALPEVAPPAVTVGVGYDYQLLSEVPVTEGDVAMDFIVTDARAMHAHRT
jgi:5-formyltetrahydrofolate cyclo-ligase